MLQEISHTEAPAANPAFSKHAVITEWKHRAHEKHNTLYNTVFYILIRSVDPYHIDDNMDKANVNYIKEWKECAKVFYERAFTPITNENKLDNGAFEYQTLSNALYALAYNMDKHAKEFGLTLSQTALTNLQLIARDLFHYYRTYHLQ